MRNTLDVEQVPVGDVVRRGITTEGSATERKRTLQAGCHAGAAMRSRGVDQNATRRHCFAKALHEGLITAVNDGCVTGTGMRKQGPTHLQTVLLVVDRE